MRLLRPLHLCFHFIFPLDRGQCCAVNWSIRDDDLQYDHGRYADVRHYLHGDAVRVYADVLLLDAISR